MRVIKGGPPATRTDSNVADVVAALRTAGAPESAIRILAAHSAHETAGWKGGLWNWNLGNLTAAGNPFVLQPGNDLPFRAFASLDEGASAFVAYLAAHAAMPFAAAGDVAGYVNRLKAINYAGNTDYVAYAAGIARWLSELPVSPPAA